MSMASVCHGGGMLWAWWERGGCALLLLPAATGPSSPGAWDRWTNPAGAPCCPPPATGVQGPQARLSAAGAAGAARSPCAGAWWWRGAGTSAGILQSRGSLRPNPCARLKPR